jgi:hypothetical protein
MDLTKAVERDMQRQREIKTFGCTQADLRNSVESSITYKFSGAAAVAAGIMSDVQEMLSSGGQRESTREQVRQMLNQSKWILFTYVMKDGE